MLETAINGYASVMLRCRTIYCLFRTFGVKGTTPFHIVLYCSALSKIRPLDLVNSDTRSTLYKFPVYANISVGIDWNHIKNLPFRDCLTCQISSFTVGAAKTRIQIPPCIVLHKIPMQDHA